jgi:hypothetical protein
VVTIGLGLGLLGGHGLASGGGTSTQPTDAVTQIGVLATPPPGTPAANPPVISGITAQANNARTLTVYTAKVAGDGPFTFTWGWAVDPGCGFLQTDSHDPTSYSSLTPCPVAQEAKAVILTCAKGPTGVSVATRSARFGDLNGQTDPQLVEQGLRSDGFSEAHGDGDCAKIVASGGQIKPTTPQSVTPNAPLLADTVPANTSFKPTAATATRGNTAVNATVAAAGVLLVIGPFIVHLRRKPKKPFVNKCNAPPCHGCPRSEQCDRDLVYAQQAYASAVADHQQSQARLKAAQEYESACREYRFQLLAYLNQLLAIVPQLQAYVASLQQYVASLQQACHLDEELLSLHGIPANDLSNGPKPGWVKLTDQLWAKDQAAADAATAMRADPKPDTGPKPDARDWPYEYPKPRGGELRHEYEPGILKAKTDELSDARTAFDAIPADHLAGAAKSGWVKVTDNLWAKDEHTANMARAAGGVDPMQVTLDWAWKNTLLINAKNDLDKANDDLDEYEQALRDVETEEMPAAESALENAEAALRRAEDDEKEKAATEEKNRLELERAKETQAACRMILKAQIEAWLADETAVAVGAGN